MACEPQTAGPCPNSCYPQPVFEESDEKHKIVLKKK